VTISANSASISPGGTSTLTWSSTNATSCFASGAWGGSEPTSGTLLVTPIFTANPNGTGAFDAYSLTCTGPGGSSTATAYVAALAPTVTITASSTQISPGQTVSLTWSSANATSCIASDAWPGTSPAIGGGTSPPGAPSGLSNNAGLTVTPTFTPNVFQSFDTYPITCTGIGGSVTAEVTVTVFGPYQKQWCGGWWGGGPCVCLRCVFGPVKGVGSHLSLGEFGPFGQIQPGTVGPVLVLLSGTVEAVSVEHERRGKFWGGGDEITTITISPGSKVVTSGELGNKVRIVEASVDSSRPKIVGVALRNGKLAGLLVVGDDQPLTAPPAK
jgi:hypothetical protein